MTLLYSLINRDGDIVKVYQVEGQNYVEVEGWRETLNQDWRQAR